MRVLGNGFNIYGQLNLPDQIIEKFTQVFENDVIINLCINHSFSVVQTEKQIFICAQKKQEVESIFGKIIKMSSNDNKVIFLNDIGNLFKIEITNFDTVHVVPKFLISDNFDEKVINISCGSKISIAYTDTGKLFNIPEKLNFESVNIIDIKCGKEHCIFLDNLGNVYTYGRGSRGQLGHGRLDDETEPLQVEGLGGIKIKQIAAGGWHCCAISIDGDLYTWGWNGNGQLGLNKEDDAEKCVSVMATPHVIDFADAERNVLKVACGSRHTIVLLDNNHLHGCGWNKYKQLKSEAIENILNFTYLHDFSNEEVVDLKSGPWNSAVLCK